MKKYTVICACLCAAFLLTGCKSKESAYRKAYEKAKAQEAVVEQTVQQEMPQTEVVTPLERRPATQQKTYDNADNVSVRQESVSLISGTGLKNFSVVVGSFGLKANAEGLQSRLKQAGHDAQIVFNPSNQMYRVVSATFDQKIDAARSRDQFRETYPDAWLLYNSK